MYRYKLGEGPDMEVGYSNAPYGFAVVLLGALFVIVGFIEKLSWAVPGFGVLLVASGLRLTRNVSNLEIKDGEVKYRERPMRKGRSVVYRTRIENLTMVTVLQLSGEATGSDARFHVTLQHKNRELPAMLTIYFSQSASSALEAGAEIARHLGLPFRDKTSS
jgi:hypothetical protein